MKPFQIDVLHPASTMVEKLFVVDATAARLLSDPLRRLPDTEARHFLDLHALWDEERSPALAWLAEGSNRADVVADCCEISERWFGSGKVPDGGFARSEAFINQEIRERLEDGYRRMIVQVCYPSAVTPTFDEICQRAQELEGRI